eukprot:1684141-Pyramimonas_sp.AAC.1
MLWQLALQTAKPTAAQYDWIVAGDFGDFSMTKEQLEIPWLHELNGMIAVPSSRTCRPTKVEQHSVIDDFMASSNLAGTPRHE